MIFKVKTNKSEYPYLIVADNFKDALEILKTQDVYDDNIIGIEQLNEYKKNHILIANTITDKEKLTTQIKKELTQTLPHWKKMGNGLQGNNINDILLVRLSRNNYIITSAVTKNDTYIELNTLEQLPGL